MGKCVFKEYDIKLHGKKYNVLVPANKIEQMWVEMWAGGLYHGDWDFCVLNRDAMQYLKCAYIAITQNPYRIIYFPIRNIEHICKEHYTQVSPDFVLYSHQLQLNRKKWKQVKQCFKYIKPRQCVIYYNMPALYQEYDQMMHQWKKSKTFYRHKGWHYRDEERMFYQHETCFIQISRKLALTGAIDIEKALKRDLETELEEHQYLNYTAGPLHSAISYEFGTAEFLRRREAEQ